MVEINSSDYEQETNDEQLDPEDIIFAGIIEAEEKMDLGAILLTVSIPTSIIGYKALLDNFVAPHQDWVEAALKIGVSGLFAAVGTFTGVGGIQYLMRGNTRLVANQEAE